MSIASSLRMVRLPWSKQVFKYLQAGQRGVGQGRVSARSLLRGCMHVAGWATSWAAVSALQHLPVK